MSPVVYNLSLCCSENFIIRNCTFRPLVTWNTVAIDLAAGRPFSALLIRQKYYKKLNTRSKKRKTSAGFEPQSPESIQSMLQSPSHCATDATADGPRF